MPYAARVSLSAPKPGEPARWATLRALNGADELLFHGLRSGGAIAATALLAATTMKLGGRSPVTAETIRELTIGDRERLLIGLYDATFGPTLELVACCPQCRELIEVDLPSDAALAPLAPEQPEPLVVGALTIHLRAPTGRDLEHAAADAGDPVRAARRLLLDCILAVTDRIGQPIDAAAMLEDIAGPVAEALRRLDPAAELRAELDCPACAAHLPALLDGFALIAAALTPEPALFAEIDALARAYGWREAEILAIPIARRRRYLALIAERRAA